MPKVHIIIMDKKLNEIRENLLPTKLTIIRLQYKILQHNKTQTYLITAQPYQQ